MRFTIDASIFVAPARGQEPNHAASVEFLRRIKLQQPLVFCPSIVLSECSAAVARRSGDAALAQDLVALVKSFSGMWLIPLLISQAERAAQIAATRRLRGADAVYVAVAEQFGATLIAWDDEMLQRGSAVVTTISPSTWLTQQASN